MDEYIKRQDAVDCLWANCDEVGSAIVPDVEAIPAADVRPVVYCKDCKWYYAYPDEYRTCHEHYEIDGVSKMMVALDFCSKAERRAEEQPPELTEK